MRPLTFALFFTCWCGFGTATADGSAEHCGPTSTDTPVATETATAGYLSNLTNRAGSIRAASKSMLDSAITTVRSDDSGRRIIFKSIPELSTKPDSDDKMCERLEQATTREPLQFDDKQFTSVDELTDWIMDFTRGKGADGKMLYEQCPGMCSPQYTWWINPDKSDLIVKARVVCGPPRNRDSDKYQLSIELAASCPGAKSQ